MILGELYNLYLRLLDEGTAAIPRPGWSSEKIEWELPLRQDGTLGEPIFLGEDGKDAPKSKGMLVPEHVSRSGIRPIPFFLCDTAAYLLGLEEKRGAEKRMASRELHLGLLEDCDGPEADALRAFFSREDVVSDLSEANLERLAKPGLCVFRVPGGAYAHDVPEIRAAWQAFKALGDGDKPTGQCGVSGETGNLARLFPLITGIPGAQSSGASLVSFNLQSFESFGKTQGYNASLSEDVAFGAGNALRLLFKDSRHRVRLGGMTVVFWADRKAPLEDAVMLELLGGDVGSAEDETTLQQVKSSVQSIRAGKLLTSLDAEVRYCVLGISPNAARLSVRLFEVGTLGRLAENYGQYLRDIDIEPEARFAERKTTALLKLLRQTALLAKDENLPAPIINPCFRAMLRGTAFPSSLETALLSRMRADHATNKPWDMMERVSLMKACLLRRRRATASQTSDIEREVTVALNRDNRNVGYLLGRLFAVMERAQQGAQGANLNATIRDKYMSSAATTPRRVYTNLLSLSQKHLGAMRRDEKTKGLVARLEREFDGIIDQLSGGDQPVPATLSTDDQLLFYIGYYHERVDLWKKRAEKKDTALLDNASDEEA